MEHGTRNPERRSASMKRSLRSWLWRVDIDQEVDDEIAFHIEMRTRELVEKGVDPRIAREMVLARIGDASRLKRTCVDLGRKRDREMRLTQWLDERRDDVRFAVRQLKVGTGIYVRRGDHARARHRRQQRHLRTRRRHLASPIALAGARPPCDRLGAKRRAATWSGIAAQHARLERPDSHLREDGGIHSGRGQHGDGQPERDHRRGSHGSGSRAVSSTCSESSRLRAGRFCRPMTRNRSSAVVLSEGFWRNRFGADPVSDRETDSARWDALYGRGRRSPGDTDDWTGERMGAHSVATGHRRSPRKSERRAPSWRSACFASSDG